MNINVDYEAYRTVISDFTESYCMLNPEWSRYSWNIANELAGPTTTASAFLTYCNQLYDVAVLLENYYSVLSSNFNAINNAVDQYRLHDENTASSIGN